MSKSFRVLVSALPLIAAAGVALGQGSPIPFQQIPCSGYALDVTPPPGGRSDQNCYSFQAVIGETIQSTCSAYVIAIDGQRYGIGCEVLIGPLNGDAFAAQASATNGDTATLSYTIPQTGMFLLETLDFGRFGFFGGLDFTLGLVSAPTCGDPTTLCIGDSRFLLSADWAASDGNSGHAAAVPLTTDTGYFWFFDSSNVEIVAKVLNGCAINNHYWFFGSGLTNVGVQITVKDTLSGAIQHYSNSPGTPFAPIQDTTAFATCP